MLSFSALTLAVVFFVNDPDTDGDGLADFQEVHKYFTDPESADSDGDGTPDGDWNERREYTYSIRTVVRVMHPTNDEAFVDDYQDARVLSRNDEYVELEVVHYPLNTCHRAIEATSKWKKAAAKAQGDYLKPGVTTNWDKKMRKHLLKALEKDGIDIDELADREFVQRVASWIMGRTESLDVFTTYMVDFKGKKPRIHPELEDDFAEKLERYDLGWSKKELWERELFGREMYYNQTRGTCTSSAVHITTVMRAAHVPTRMVLAIPLVDPSDTANVQLVRDGITHHAVRKAILEGLAPLESSFSAHTFNEVWVGGRWRRLNYSELGQNIIDRGLFGLLTHVHTFSDLSEAGLAEGWGARHPLRKESEVFRHANPYTALEVSDLFGEHANIANPEISDGGGITNVTIGDLYWATADRLPSDIDRARFPKDGNGHLFLHAEEPLFGVDASEYHGFYENAGKRFRLEADGEKTIEAACAIGFWINSDTGSRDFYVRILPDQYAKMKRNVAYTLVPYDTGSWTVAPNVTITRE